MDTDIVSTDLQRNPARRLLKNFSSGTKAVGTASPNTLNSNLPSLKDAMGVTGTRGILSMILSTGGDVSLYLWNAHYNRINPAKGWVLVAESAALNTKTTVADAILSFKCDHNTPYFIQSSATSDECLVADAGPHPLNKNTDTTKAQP